MHSPDIRQKFIELRAAAHSIPKISSLLNVAQSTLRLWEKDDAWEIARLRRIYWEDAEDRVGITLENRLRRMAEWIEGAEDELEKRHFDLMNNRDLMRFLRESRREYFRLRAMLFSAENTLERTHHTRVVTPDVRRGLKSQDPPANPTASSANISNADSVDSACTAEPSDIISANSCPQAIPSLGGDGQDEGDCPSPEPTSTPQTTDQIGELADSPPTQPLNTNNLQQPKSSLADFPDAITNTEPLINTPLQRGELTRLTAAPTASAVFPGSHAPSFQSEISNVKFEIPLAPYEWTCPEKMDRGYRLVVVIEELVFKVDG